MVAFDAPGMSNISNTSAYLMNMLIPSMRISFVVYAGTPVVQQHLPHL